MILVFKMETFLVKRLIQSNIFNYVGIIARQSPRVGRVTMSTIAQGSGQKLSRPNMLVAPLRTISGLQAAKARVSMIGKKARFYGTLFVSTFLVVYGLIYLSITSILYEYLEEQVRSLPRTGQ